MNIHVSSPIPYSCAERLDNVRLNKMITETAQMLSMWCHYHEHYSSVEYDLGATHLRHPCFLWLLSDQRHYDWTVRYFTALCQEWEARRGKVHKGATLIGDFVPHAMLGNAEPDWFQNAARSKVLDIDYTHIEDVHQAYLLYLNDRWDMDEANGREPKWGW